VGFLKALKASGIEQTEKALFLALILMASVSYHTHAGDEADHATVKQELLDLTSTYLTALSEKDVGTLERVLLPDIQFTFVREGESGPVTRVTSRDELLASLPHWDTKMEERLSAPQVLVQGRIASLWASYEYFSNGELSHCGVDSFTFMHLAEGWIISGLSWSIEAHEELASGVTSCR